MKILIDAHVLDEPHQGTRTYIKGLYSELIKLRPDIFFYFAAHNLENLRSEIGHFPNVRFLRLRQGKFLRLLFEIPFLIWKYKIDYAHFQYVSPPIKNCKYIVTTHDILFKDFRKLFPLKYKIVKDILFRISAMRADLLFTVSEFSRQRISMHYKIPIEKIGITANGVPHAFFNTDDLNKNQIKEKYGLREFILYVSRIEPRKNHLLLLQAFMELRLWEKNYQLVFIGKKDFLFHDIYSFLANCPKECRNNILHIENVSNTELISFYRIARLFVYPSLAEGFGIPPIEAIAAGTPTLCSNATAMSDFSFLGDDLFNAQDLKTVKTKISNKLLHPDDSVRLNYLKEIVKEKYSWNQSAKAFLADLEKHFTRD